MKPFDLKAAKRGDPICLRGGPPVKFLLHVPEIGRVIVLYGNEILTRPESGTYCHGRDEFSQLDLMMAPKPPVRKWYNVYSHGVRGYWTDRAQAEEIGRIAVTNTYIETRYVDIPQE